MRLQRSSPKNNATRRSRDCVHPLSLWEASGEEVSHLLALGFEILFRIRRRFDFARNTFCDSNATLFESSDLVGIVRKQTHALDVKRAKYLDGQVVVTAIGLEAKLLVGLNGVEAFVL